MTNLARVVVQLDGWVGGPGVNVLHFSEGFTPPWDEELVEDLVGTLYDAYNACKDMLAPSVTVTVPAAVSIIDAGTGELVDIITSPSTPSVITSTGTSGSTSRAAQFCVRLNTSKFINGRRLQGRFFFGPMGGGLLSSTGQVTSTLSDNFSDAFSGLISGTGPRMAVWHRPKAGFPTSGDYGDVISVTASPTPGTLRSRVI